MMKMKHVLALVLTFVMLFSTTITALANESNQPQVAVTEQGISINDKYYTQDEFIRLLDSAVLLEKSQSKSAAAIIAGTWWIPGIGEVVITAAGVIAIGGAIIAAGSWIYNTVVDWFITLQFNDSAEKAVNNCDTNRQHHIMVIKHNWNKFNKNPKWSDIAPILIKVLKDGKETWETNSVYIRTLVYKGETVVVRFVKDANGLVKSLSTAWTK